VTDEAGVVALVDDATREAFPELVGVEIGVAPVDDLAYFRAWTEVDTVARDDGRARTYTVQYDPVVLADPMDPASLAALVVHELGHVEDYVAMDSAELVSFAIWYGSQDPATSDELAAYERATDEKALVRGCAAGLSAAREWIYAASADDPVRLAEKQRNYWTPDEIAAWVDAGGGCAR
jgi:hypothetical protein